MNEQPVTSPPPPADPTRPADPQQPQQQQGQASADAQQQAPMQQGVQQQGTSKIHLVPEAMQPDQPQPPRQPTPTSTPVVTVTSSTMPMRTAELEAAELDGVCSTEMYAQLLACYLAMSKWKLAQLLHSRLPASPRKSDEVKAVWAVGKPLIQRKLPQAYRAYHDATFSDALKPYMEVVLQQSRQAALDLAAHAYCKIKVANLALLVNHDGDELKSVINQRGWTVAGDFVTPVKPDDQKGKHPGNDGILEVTSLVDYASFLEN